MWKLKKFIIEKQRREEENYALVINGRHQKYRFRMGNGALVILVYVNRKLSNAYAFYEDKTLRHQIIYGIGGSYKMISLYRSGRKEHITWRKVNPPLIKHILYGEDGSIHNNTGWIIP